jgi:hypothetical protein
MKRRPCLPSSTRSAPDGSLGSRPTAPFSQEPAVEFIHELACPVSRESTGAVAHARPSSASLRPADRLARENEVDPTGIESGWDFPLDCLTGNPLLAAQVDFRSLEHRASTEFLAAEDRTIP